MYDKVDILTYDQTFGYTSIKAGDRFIPLAKKTDNGWNLRYGDRLISQRYSSTGKDLGSGMLVVRNNGEVFTPVKIGNSLNITYDQGGITNAWLDIEKEPLSAAKEYSLFAAGFGSSWNTGWGSDVNNKNHTHQMTYGNRTFSTSWSNSDVKKSLVGLPASNLCLMLSELNVKEGTNLICSSKISTVKNSAGYDGINVTLETTYQDCACTYDKDNYGYSYCDWFTDWWFPLVRHWEYALSANAFGKDISHDWVNGNAHWNEKTANGSYLCIGDKAIIRWASKTNTTGNIRISLEEKKRYRCSIWCRSYNGSNPDGRDNCTIQEI